MNTFSSTTQFGFEHPCLFGSGHIWMKRMMKLQWMLKELKDSWNFNDPSLSINWRVIRNRREWDHKWHPRLVFLYRRTWVGGESTVPLHRSLSPVQEQAALHHEGNFPPPAPPYRFENLNQTTLTSVLSRYISIWFQKLVRFIGVWVEKNPIELFFFFRRGSGGGWCRP